MPLTLANRVKESSSSSGSGVITLSGPMAGYQAFSSVLSNNDTTYYTILNGNEWEVGIGTFNSNSISRDTILSSSNSNNKLNLQGSSFVFIAYPSEKSVYKDQNNQVVAGSSGILISNGTPGNTSGVLYNVNNTLYFNGYPLSVSGHSHSVSDITNFASGVSGLLPVISITGGYGIGVTNTSGNHTIYSTLNTVNEAYTLVSTVFNRNGSALPKFTVVYISGGQGDLPIVTPALANGEPKSSKTFGITQEQIPAMSSGHVVVYGNIYGLDTDQFNPNAPHGDINGQVLYLSPTVSGGLTLTKPYAPDHMVSLGTVIRTHQNEGIFNVRIQNGFELQELHNVASTGAVSGQFLKYDGSTWRNTGITSSDISDFSSAVSGISPNISISGTSGISVDKNGNNYTVYTTGTFGLSSSQVQSLLNSGVSIYVTSGTGNFSSLSVNGTGVSLSGHTHTASNITNFNSSVSGLLPSVSGSGYASVGFSNNIYTVSVTGLQPTGNYSVSGHTHTSSNITDFNSSVSGLLPVKNISGSGYVVVSSSGGSFTVGVTGLQPSGNYSVSGHQHTASDITNFNSSVSGLLTPYALLSSGNFTNLFVSGTRVSVSGHTHTSSQITDFNSSVSGLLPVKNISGSGYVIVTSSTGNYIVSVSGLQPSGNYSISGHTHLSSDITNFTSTVSGILSSGVNIKLLNGSGTLQSLTITDTGTLGTLQINKFYHNNLAIASGFSDTDMLIAILTPTGTATTQMLQGSTLRSSLLNQPASLRFRQGTESERLLITPATGEPIWVTNTKKFYIGDGTTVGGIFMSPVSISGSGNVIVNTVSGVSTISVSGLSASGHTHTSSNITDFNSSVSGLIPVKDILAGTNIDISNTSGIFTISVTGISASGGGVSGSGYSPFTTGTLDTAILPTITSGNVNNELHSTIINGYNNSISNVGAAGTFDQCSIINGNNNQIYNNVGFNVSYCTIDNGQSNELRDSIKCTILNGDSNVVNYGSSKCLIGVGDATFIDSITSYSTALNGNNHTLTGPSRSTILNGNTNGISTIEYGSIINGLGNIVNGNHCTILGGINNTLNTSHSVVLGGIGVVNSNIGELVFGGSTDFGQKSTFVLHQLTTDSATATQLVLDSSLNQMSIPPKTTWNFNIQLSAYNYTDHTGAGFNFRGVVRSNSVGSANLLGNTIVEKWTEGSMSGVLASVSVDGTFGVVVNGLSGKNIRWAATVEISQVQGP